MSFYISLKRCTHFESCQSCIQCRRWSNQPSKQLLMFWMYLQSFIQLRRWSNQPSKQLLLFRMYLQSFIQLRMWSNQPSKQFLMLRMYLRCFGCVHTNNWPSFWKDTPFSTIYLNAQAFLAKFMHFKWLSLVLSTSNS